MKILDRIFGKHKNKEVMPETQHVIPEEKRPYDYGLNALIILLRNENWSVATVEDEKKRSVWLVNPVECKEKVNLMGMLSSWRDIGCTEWAAFLGGLFIQALLEAFDKEAEEADISSMFNCTLEHYRAGRITSVQVYEYLIKYFDIVEETDEVLRLRIRL